MMHLCSITAGVAQLKAYAGQSRRCCYWKFCKHSCAIRKGTGTPNLDTDIPIGGHLEPSIINAVLACRACCMTQNLRFRCMQAAFESDA